MFILHWVLLVSASAALLNGQVSERARKLHQDALVFDAHVHIGNRQFYTGTDLSQRYPDGHVDLPRLKEGGLDVMLFSLSVGERYYPARHETKQTLRLLDSALIQIERNSDKIEVALNASDVDRIVKQRKIAAILDLEGCFDLDGDLGVLRSLYRLGLRAAMLPAHNWANEFADSCCAPPKWGGINEQGRKVVREMNRLGMVINISHASDQTVEQTVEVSSHPVIASHHGLRSFNDIPRNMPDHVLKKLASKGGVIAFHIGHSFHSKAFYDWETRRRGKVFFDTSEIGQKEARMSIAELDRVSAKALPSVGPQPPDELWMSVDDYLKVVERAIALVGEDHVALGSDFDGRVAPPREIRDVRDYPALTEGMLRRGWSEQRIRKFLGENLMRVFRQVTEK
ncbi:MAG: dipeptidase [Bryobacteraceae bacterium]